MDFVPQIFRFFKVYVKGRLDPVIFFSDFHHWIFFPIVWGMDWCLAVFSMNLPCQFPRVLHNLLESLRYTFSSGCNSGYGYWPQTGSEALHLERREILKILFSRYFRSFQKSFFLFSYFWCQTFHWCPRSRNWIPARNQKNGTGSGSTTLQRTAFSGLSCSTLKCKG